MKPTLYIISGCNGSGKTTASFNILPELLGIDEFVNADEIAKGLSPFRPEKVSIEAGRIMLSRIDELMRNQKSFAFETTLSSKIYQNKIRHAKKVGYKVILVFFWLNSIDLAKDRVALRVKEGGHNIPEEIIHRRYIRGLKNLFNLYLHEVSEWIIIDSSQKDYSFIASLINGVQETWDLEKWRKLKTDYENKG